MEITREQITKLTALIGKEKLVEIIPEANIPEFHKNKIYIYEIYKLHRVDGDKYAWIDMTTSNCYANGVGTAEDLIRHAGKNLMVFDSYNDYLSWLRAVLL